MGAKKQGRIIRSGNRRLKEQAGYVNLICQAFHRKIMQLELRLEVMSGVGSKVNWLAEMVETCRRHNLGEITNEQCRSILKNLIEAAYAGTPGGGYGRLQQPDVLPTDGKEKVLTPDQQKDLFKKNGSSTV